jgi:xanthosine utilization system XapX-like protein
MSRVPSKWNIWSITLLALLAIGLVYSVVQSPAAFIIPIVVLGGIFLLYKYPPAFLRGNITQRGRTEVKQSRAAAAKMKANKPRSKTVPFRVIEGGKDDDDLPKYH